MRRLLGLALVAASFAATTGRADAASPIWPQPQQYTAHLRYDEHHAVLAGRERITFLNDGPRSLSSIWLRVWPNGYGSCKRRYARVSVTEGGVGGGWKVGCTALRVRLAHPVGPSAGGSVAVRLRVKVPKNNDRFGRVGSTVYLGNALPLLDVEDSSGASLEPYTKMGDPFYSRVARWSVTLDVPRWLVAATTGSVTSRRSVGGGVQRLTIAAADARDFAIVLGHFATVSTVTSGGVRLVRYRQSGARRSVALRDLRAARAAVERFTAWYGEPVEREIDLTPGIDMEYPGLVMVESDPYPIAHELAHQWWYGVVSNDQWRSPWLDESFAEFSARRLPSLARRDDLHCNHDKPVSGPLTAPMSHWEAAARGKYYGTVYLGGTCALRSLESDIGAQAMTAFLRSYIDAHRFGIVTTADFVAGLRSAAPPGYDVNAFLHRAHIPASGG